MRTHKVLQFYINTRMARLQRDKNNQSPYDLTIVRAVEPAAAGGLTKPGWVPCRSYTVETSSFRVLLCVDMHINVYLY